jgi:hypothetical protein
VIKSDVQYYGRHRRNLDTLIAEAPAMNRRTAEDVAQLLVEGNRIDRLRGIDPDGKPLQPVRVRVGAYAGATGPPLAPFGEASSSIAAFYARHTTSRDGWTVTAGFQGPMAPILKYHAEGKSGTGHPITVGGKLVGFKGIKGATTGIRRDVFGVGRKTLEEVTYLIGRQRSWMRDVLRGIPFLGSGVRRR